MADRRPPAMKLPIVCKAPVVQATLPASPAQQEQDAVQHAQQDQVQPPVLPVQVPNPVQPLQVQPGQAQLNWSYFKPELSGNSEEDAKAHLLRTNDWMETHNFPE